MISFYLTLTSCSIQSLKSDGRDQLVLHMAMQIEMKDLMIHLQDAQGCCCSNN